MNLINCTPHTVVVLHDGERCEFLISGTVARLVEGREQAEPINGLPSCYISYGQIDGLPDPLPDTFYIVSALVGPVAAAQGRHDIVAPDTGKAIREQGQIVGVPGFVRY